MTLYMQDILERSDVCLAYFVRISGIPYLFSNVALPADWATGPNSTNVLDGPGSFVYGWRQSLLLERGFGKVKTKAEPKAGLGTVGGMKFGFTLAGTDDPSSDVWMSMLVKDILRSDEDNTQTTATVDADEVTSIAVTDTTGWPSTGFLYLGTETIYYTSTTATTFGGLTRGVYGSWPQCHLYERGDLDSLPQGPVVASWPLGWQGRLVSLYAVAGRLVDGVWTPLTDGAGTYGAVIQQVYQGVLKDVSYDDGTSQLMLSTSGLDSILNQEVCSRLPKFKVLDTLKSVGTPLLHVDQHNWHISWTWTWRSNTTPSPIELRNVRLLNTTGTADLGAGLYSAEELGACIRRTIQANSPPATLQDCKLYFGWRGAIGSGLRAKLTITTATSDYALQLHPASYGAPNLFYDLGYKQTVEAEGEAVTVGIYYEFPDPPEAPMRFRWPNSLPKPSRIYYDPASLQDVDLTPGWTTHAGNPIYGFLKIGDSDIVQVNNETSETPIDGIARRYFVPIGNGGEFDARGKAVEVRWEEGEPKLPEITQCLALRSMPLSKAILYLVMSGSGVPGTLDATYDKGWLGSGLALPPDVIDVEGFERAGYGDFALLWRDHIVVTKPTKLKDILTDELVLSQCALIPQADYSTGDGFKLRLARMTAPMETGDTARVLDHTVADTSGGISIDRSDNNIINRCVIESEFDHATQKFNREYQGNHITSLTTYGPQDTFKLKIRSIRSSGSNKKVLKPFVDRIFARYAFPYTIIEVVCAAAQTWGWQVGDTVRITLDQAPAFSTVSRGWTDVYAKLYVKEDDLLGDKYSSKLTLITRADLGRRYSTWAPSMLLTSPVNSPTNTIWNVDPHYFSGTNDPTDLSYFDTQYRVYVNRLGSSSSYLGRVITALDTVANTVTFDTGVTTYGSGGDIIVCLRTYEIAGQPDSALLYPAFSGSDGELAAPSATTRKAFYFI